MTRTKRRIAFPLSPVVLIPLLALLACGRDPAPPNLLIVTIDTLRADHLSCYGYPRETSPEIDAFASQAGRFTRCISPISTTLPSHLTLFTGLDPIAHGVLTNFGQGVVDHPAPEGLVTLAEIAQQHGYATAAFVSATPLKISGGIAQGFDVFDEPDDEERNARETNDEVIPWLRSERGEGPFLLWVHYYDPHWVYDAPVTERFGPEPWLEAWIDERVVLPHKNLEGDSIPAIEMLSRYDDEIRFVDAEFGRLLRALGDEGLRENTAIVLTSDHGEGLGQHGNWHHGYTSDEQLRVPLVLDLPGGEPGVYDGIVPLRAVVPGVLRACGLFPDAPLPGAEESGGRKPGTLFERGAGAEPAFSVSTFRRVRRTPRERYTLTGERWKYLLTAGEPDTLYDLSADPFELRDVAAANPDVTAELRDRTLREIARQQQQNTSLALVETPAAIDRKLERELRTLGYID